MNRIELSYTGIGQMLRGEEMRAFIAQKGQEAANRAGFGYRSDVHNSGQRQIANVYPGTKKAQKDNLKNNTLLRSMK